MPVELLSDFLPVVVQNKVQQFYFCMLFMLQTDCKLDQFVNGPPVCKPVNRFLNWLACFQLYKAKWSRL